MDVSAYLAPYTRYVWHGPDLIVVAGEAEKLWQGCSSYNSTCRVAAGASAGEALLKRLLAAAGLAAVLLDPREFWGWSVSLPGMADGFFCGAEPEGMLCCRMHAKAEKASGLCVVQRQGGKTPLVQSHVTLATQDPVEAVKRYFEEAEQSLIRIAVAGDGRAVLLRPLPGGSFDELHGVSDEELIRLLFGHAGAGKLQLLEDVRLFYGCPCSSEKIAAMVRALPAEQAGQLWGNDRCLETTCPRCGRVYELTR